MKVLWRRIQKGNEQAFSSLFDTYYKRLCLYVLQFTNNLDEAEDIVQEVFVKLWEKRHAIEINASLKSYLYRAAYNAYIDKLRREKRNDMFLTEFKYQILQSQVEESNEVDERLPRIKQVVDRLPEKCKEIFMLSKSEGLKNKEIAMKLGISIKTVESQMRIAFQKIRQEFE